MFGCVMCFKRLPKWAGYYIVCMPVQCNNFISLSLYLTSYTIFTRAHILIKHTRKAHVSGTLATSLFYFGVKYFFPEGCLTVRLIFDELINRVNL